MPSSISNIGKEGDRRQPLKRQSVFHPNFDASVVPKKLAILVLTLLSSANIIVKKIMMVHMINYGAFVVVTQALRNVVVLAFVIFICVVVRVRDQHGRLLDLQQLNPLKVPWKYFFMLGSLDTLVSSSAYFAYAYLPGRLLILIQQGLIPLNSAIFFKQLGKKGKVGSFLIFVGIFSIFIDIGLARVAGNTCLPIDADVGTTCTVCRDIGNDEDECLLGTNSDICMYGEDNEGRSVLLKWSLILVASCIPQFLSIQLRASDSRPSKKNHPLSNTLIVCFVDVLFSILMSVLLAWIAEPTILPKNWAANMEDGIRCLGGNDTIETGCFVDNCYASRVLVNVYVIVNLLSQLFMFRFASHPDAEDIMLVSLSLTVPICTLCFMIPGFPTQDNIGTWINILSLVLIVVGLGIYRQDVLGQDSDKEDSDNGELSSGNVIDSEPESWKPSLTVLHSSKRASTRNLLNSM